MYYGPLSMPALTTELGKVQKAPVSFNTVSHTIQFKRTEQKENEVLFAEYDMVQADIRWLRNASAFNAAQIPVATLFNNYFGSGMGAIVFQTIRESKALAYSTFASYISPAKASEPFAIVGFVGTQADKMKEAIAAMNELFNKLPEAANTFDAAKSAIKKDLETERITKDAIMLNYLGKKRLGIHYDNRKEIYEAMKKLQFNDIQKLHNAEFANKPYTYCVVGNPAKLDMKVLESAGKVKQLQLKEIFGY